MEIKFKKSYTEYKYLVMFDLASKISGVCLWDIINKKPLQTKILKVSGKTELPAAELNDLIDNYFCELQKNGFSLHEIIVSKEQAPLQSGKFTTAQTLIALGKSHAVLDVYCYKHNIDVYDYIGVAPITTHAYIKRIYGWDNKHPVEKTDIQTYIKETYNFDTKTLDESDAVFLAKTLLDVHWNNQLDEKIREEKRHRKTLKANHAIKSCDVEIERLKGLKNL